MILDAKVKLWNKDIGVISWDEENLIGVFKYFDSFLNSGIEVSPIMMPLEPTSYTFPTLAKETFKGLPGLLSDSLPDRFGNAVINAWLASQGRSEESFNPIERLCYTGKRGMGALEYEPSQSFSTQQSKDIEVSSLVNLANSVLNERNHLDGMFNGIDDKNALDDIIKVAASAGGARAKALLAFNPETNKFRSGQLDLKEGYEHWLMKFDGVSKSGDHGIADPQGYGKIEYAYYLMAKDAGIDISKCMIHEEGGRSHFMTKRFDRTDQGKKIHMQSLGAMAHYDYNQANAYSYEQAIQVMRRLKLDLIEIRQFVLRAFFNVITRNQDDHVKNIAFLMDKKGQWKLAPAFDITYSFNPTNIWTKNHQMSISNQRDHFSIDHLIDFAVYADIKKHEVNNILSDIKSSVKKWQEFANQAKINPEISKQLYSTFRTKLLD